MSLLEAIILGIVQGLTEFLPISSTAHLRVVPALLGWSDPGPAFSAVIQCGTLAAVLIYFRSDLWRIGSAWFSETFRGKFCQSHDGTMGWLMILGTIPIVIAGKLFEDQIDTAARSLYVISASLIGLACVLIVAEWYARRRVERGLPGRGMEQTGFFDAVVMGLAQGLALVPGSSRSGVTITAGLFCGLSRDAAARFSFLLSMPAVLAAGLYKLMKERHVLLGTSQGMTNVIVCTLVSAVVGYAAIAFLLTYLRKHTTWLFIIYRLIAGSLLLGLLAAGVLQPMDTSVKSARPAAQVKHDSSRWVVHLADDRDLP